MVVFFRSFIPTSFTVEIKGCFWKVKVPFEQVKAVFICVYPPTNGVERTAVLDILCDILKNCDSDEFLFLGVILTLLKTQL